MRLQLAKPMELSGMCWESKPTSRAVKSGSYMQISLSPTEPRSPNMQPSMGMLLLNHILEQSCAVAVSLIFITVMRMLVKTEGKAKIGTAH